jgi:DNA-directed RNA polymerase specialized sigma24 family protein
VGLQSKKRDTTHVTSIQNSTEQGDEFEIFLEDKQTNVENYVVNKVFIERLLKRVNKHQRAVLYYHLQGYTFNEISQILGRGNLQTMHQAYTLAIKKMRQGA